VIQSVRSAPKPWLLLFVHSGYVVPRSIDDVMASIAASIHWRADLDRIQPRTCILLVIYRRSPSRAPTLTPLLEHAGDRLDDADIAGAAAEIAAELAADARLVRVGQARDDVMGGGEHPRRAEAAL
jgi:hypothetical protein